MGIFEIIGLVTVLFLLVRLGTWAARTFVIKSSALKRVAPKNAQNWAIITGCTSGVGEGFAEELAARGLNVVLVSRTLSKLQEAQKRIEEKHRVKTEVVAIDFCKDSAEEYMNRLGTALGKIEGNVSVLVNNVGVNYHETPNKFLEVTEAEQRDMVRVNVEATMNVTRIALPRMVQQKKGIVINLSSYVAVCPTPLMAVYSGTKAFVEAWSTAMSEEYRRSGVDIIAINPMYVVSQMSGFRKPSLMACAQRRIAADTLNSLGTAITPTAYSPYFMHEILIFAQKLIPSRILLGLQLGQLQGVKARLLKKKARATAAAGKSQ